MNLIINESTQILSPAPLVERILTRGLASSQIEKRVFFKERYKPQIGTIQRARMFLASFPVAQEIPALHVSKIFYSSKFKSKLNPRKPWFVDTLTAAGAGSPLDWAPSATVQIERLTRLLVCIILSLQVPFAHSWFLSIVNLPNMV